MNTSLELQSDYEDILKEIDALKVGAKKLVIPKHLRRTYIGYYNFFSKINYIKVESMAGSLLITKLKNKEDE